MVDTSVTRFRAQTRVLRERTALRLLASGGSACDEALTWGEWGEQVDRTACALLAAGVARGECVAVYAGNGLLWPVADLAILSVGAVSVGAYETATPEQLRHYLNDSEARIVLVDTRERLERLLQVRTRLPALRTVVCAEGDAEGAQSLDRWLAAGDGNGRARTEMEARIAGIGPEDPAVIVYTSGSTAAPKGAVLSHRYLVASADSIAETLGLGADDRTLSILPYAHASERIFGLHTRITAGTMAGIVVDPQRVWSAAAELRPTVFGGMPRLFERAAERIRDHWRATSGPERERWDRAFQLGRQRSRLRQRGGVVAPQLQAEWQEAGAPLFAAAAELFGNQLRVASSGGAPLPREAAELLDAAGVTVLGAYGLTEHLCVAFNRPERYTFDAAGPPMPGTEIRIAGDGEILVRRGPLTFSQYLGRPVETREAFTEDGAWLRTGDLGSIDQHGFLRVTGRKKELIALSTGKKVAPAAIEERLARHPLVAQAMLYGEGKKFLVALICLQSDGSPPASDPDSPCRDPQILAEVGRVVEEVNADAAGFEQVVRFVVIARELSAERGEVTDTMKVRRAAVSERFREQLEALYGENR